MTSRLSTTLQVLGLCLLLTLVVPCFFSSIRIYFLAAPMVMLFYNATRVQTLLISLLCGCYLDALMASPRFGFLGLSFAITSWFLYDWRLYFFKDSRSTILIMTYCFSFLLTIVQNVVALIFDLPTPVYSLSWVFSDLVVMPLVDAFFAWTFFSLVPSIWQFYRLYMKRRKEREE